MNIDRYKVRVQRQIVIVSSILLVAKFVAYYMTNSVGVFTDAMESIVNVVAEMISLYSLNFASKPKDKEHPFGHGKAETLSASLEGFLIAVAGTVIIYEGVGRLITPEMPKKLDIGILIVAAAGLINYILGWYSIRVGRKHDSIALVAGGKHLQSDTISSIGLVIGLIILSVTKLLWIDGALALLFGGIILVTGVKVLRETIAGLLDAADSQMLIVVSEMLSKNRRENWIDVHNLKVAKYGGTYHVNCDLTLPWYYNIRESHIACDELVDAFGLEFSDRVQLAIHSDPCKPHHCSGCLIHSCSYRLHPFNKRIEFSVEQITNSDEANRLAKLSI